MVVNYSNDPVRYFHFKALLRSSGWMSPAYVGVDARGIVRYLSDQPPADVVPEQIDGLALPGFQNAHSHAFQFAMAGIAEKHAPGTNDDFWTWREAMYECALGMDPDEMQAVATMLYVEMLKKGYTHVAEFHYLHHDKNGKAYNNLSEMSTCLVAAAALAGIKITLVPVYYEKGGFGKEPHAGQRRFIFTGPDQYFQLLDEAAQMVRNISTAGLGFGVHSLRAADADRIKEIYSQGPKDLPFHIHAAEQLQEVQDCEAYLKQRPIEWLVNNLPLNERFHIVHATHMSEEEVKALAKSGANVVTCPSTEGNLGDGIFRLTDFAKNGGHWSIGTDSHIGLNPLEDLRWLDYAQRMTTHRRNTFDDGAMTLLTETVYSGRKAMGIAMNDFFETGQPLDAVVYSTRSPLLSACRLDHLLPSILYTADGSSVYGTLVNGKWIIKDHKHPDEEDIAAKFRKAVKKFR